MSAPRRLRSNRVRELEARIRDLERLLRRKVLEVEVLKEALAAARSNLVERMKGASHRVPRISTVAVETGFVPAYRHPFSGADHLVT